MSTPLIRPGIIYFIGTFFGFDEETFSNNFILKSDKIEKNALSFYQNIKPLSDTKMSPGSEIICTTLGLPIRDLMPVIDIPQKYVSQVWTRIMYAQGIQIVFHKIRDEWGLGYKMNEKVKEAFKKAMKRWKESPTSNSPDIIKSSETFVNMVHKPLVQKLSEDIEKSERILFITKDAFSAREAFPYLLSCGIEYKEIGTTEIISKDKRMITEVEKLDKVRCLVISVNYFSLRYYDKKYDLIVMWDFPEILKAVHVEDPLPNFIKMSVNDKRKNSLSYYKDLWKVADTFHILREFMTECNKLWFTEMENKYLPFIQKIRGHFYFDSSL